MKMHWIPGRPFSWPSGGKRNPSLRTFLIRGDVSVCEFGRHRPATSNPDDVTCATCRKRMQAGRFDDEKTISTVLARGTASELPGEGQKR